MNPARDPHGNLGRIVDIRSELKRRADAARAEKLERTRKLVKAVATNAGVYLAVALLIYFVWRGIAETFT